MCKRHTWIINECFLPSGWIIYSNLVICKIIWIVSSNQYLMILMEKPLFLQRSAMILPERYAGLPELHLYKCRSLNQAFWTFKFYILSGYIRNKNDFNSIFIKKKEEYTDSSGQNLNYSVCALYLPLSNSFNPDGMKCLTNPSSKLWKHSLVSTGPP